MSQIDVTIMGQSYKLACKEGEQAMLAQAAAYLNEKMQHFKELAKNKSTVKSTATGTDRIAIMAALTIAAELLAIKAPDGSFSELSMAEMYLQLQAMNTVLDKTLALQEN